MTEAADLLPTNAGGRRPTAGITATRGPGRPLGSPWAQPAGIRDPTADLTVVEGRVVHDAR